MSEIAIYIEGGRSGKAVGPGLREGFNAFLRTLGGAARAKGMRLKPVACGARGDAYNDFLTAIELNPAALNVLLVDSEAPVPTDGSGAPVGTWEHLRRQDHWPTPNGVGDDQCFLMTQCMEAWLLADPESLRKHYGACFDARALPKRRDLEDIAKDDVLGHLERATRKCGSSYRKSHAFAILRTTSPAKVRAAAPGCRRLFEVIGGVIQNA